ncbi:MAG: AAA family ATPase [Bacteroidales bacterium]|nr:AAA family ATPase [Bacteroidales bacterium]
MEINDLFDDELDDALREIDDNYDKTGDEYEEPAEWTIILALERVLDQAKGSQLSKKFWETCKNPLTYLTNVLGLSKVQVVFLAILVETGEPMAWRDFGKFLHCNRLSIMVHSDELEGLVEKRWVLRRLKCYGTEGFSLENGVITALRHNKTYVPEKIDGLDIQTFVEKMERHIDRNMNNSHVYFEDDEKWLVQLCKANPHLPLCHEVLRFKDDLHIQSLLMMFVYDYAQWADSSGEGLRLADIHHFYPDDSDAFDIADDLKSGSHILMREGYIEYKCEDGVANNEQFTLTRKAKEELLRGYTPSRSKCERLTNPRDLKGHQGIKAKEMFYNPTEQAQIERLTSLLSQENLPGVQERLEKRGMRKGFACLFFGGPGTGKTETVLQIARQTGRDIMQIDIAAMRDKFVGESEKNIKAVFTRYRAVCRQSEVMPILFFNEADGIFGRRTAIGGHNPSVEKMDNAMQNIILQEMEELDGILIATTNLTNNLDDAFERRFLFKVEFQKPDVEVKAKLWRSMLDDITDDDARRLADRYDFSGGQIENIARKCAIEFILSGKEAGFDMVEEFCKHELIKNASKEERKSIGFKFSA